MPNSVTSTAIAAILLLGVVSIMSKYTLKELEQHTCSSFGGNNCVLHGCMFFCQLAEAKKDALAKEKGITKEELNRILECKKS